MKDSFHYLSMANHTMIQKHLMEQLKDTGLTLGQPQELAQALAKMSAAATFINAVVSVILVAIIYNAVRPVLIKSHLLVIGNNKKEQAA